MAQWVKPQLWYRLQIWLGFHLWPGNFHMSQAEPIKGGKKEKSFLHAIIELFPL